jgi:uncharacterized protein (TIGR02285 family)
VASLLQMQQRGRLDGVLGYWPEVRYLAPQEQIDSNQLVFLPVRGVPRYQPVYIACSNTPAGRAVVGHLNQVLVGLRASVLPVFYADWLETAARADYLRDSRRFFEEAAQH